MEKTINIIGDLDDVKTEQIIKKLFEIEKLIDELDSVKELDIIVNIFSSGGWAASSRAIYDILTKFDKTRNVTVSTRAFGICASAAFIIFLAGRNRAAGKHTIFLTHQQSLETASTLSDLERELIIYKLMESKYDEIIKNKTKIDQDMLEMHRKDDWYITTEEALTFKIIHEIL